MIQVPLVDDQPLIHTGFKTIPETEFGTEVANEMSNGTRGVELVLELRPDAICTGVQTPWTDGIEATREFMPRGCDLAVLILTTFDRNGFLFEILQTGTSGFLLEIAEVEKLVEAVQILGHGKGSLPLQVTRRVIEHFTASRQELHCPGRVTARVLAEREHDILLHLVRGLSNAETATETPAGPETVKTHVSNILTKLGLRDRINAIIWAYENGPVPRSS